MFSLLLLRRRLEVRGVDDQDVARAEDGHPVVHHEHVEGPLHHFARVPLDASAARAVEVARRQPLLLPPLSSFSAFSSLAFCFCGFFSVLLPLYRFYAVCSSAGCGRVLVVGVVVVVVGCSPPAEHSLQHVASEAVGRGEPFHGLGGHLPEGNAVGRVLV